MALFVMLSNMLMAQQSPSIQTGVTFQWSDTQANNNQPATIQSVTIGGTLYNTFVVPTSYEMTRLGPDGHTPNRIRQNGGNVGGNSGQANWITNATAAFQDKNLNHYFTANPNGRNICSNFGAASTTDAQKQTIFYSPAIPSNEGAVLAVTERGGNNCFYIEVWGIPAGGGAEQKLGETFVRNVGNYRNCVFAPPVAGSDYWQSGRCNENGQTIAIGLFYLDDIAPTGSQITRIEFIAATRDHGDGKFFILQKYAVDQQNLNCVDTKYSGDLSINNNVPDSSTYSLVSGPSPAGQSFTLNSDGTYSYVPADDYTGDVIFQYEVCLPAPNTSVCDRATATISFVDLPSIPEASIGCDSNSDDFTISVTSPLGAEFEYSINNGTYQSSPDFNNLSEGSYILSVRSSFTRCENTNPTAFVIDNLELTGNVTDVLCNPDESGSIDITVSGGEPPYTYTWSNSTTDEDLTNSASGTYTVTVTDANGCSISRDFTINQPSEELTSTISATTDVLCNGENTGAIDLTISGGTAPYTVLWSNGSSDQDLSDLAAGDYDVTITDANGCTTTNQTTINQPTEALSANVTNITNVDCNGNSSGSITVEASNGTSPYQYSLDNGSTNQGAGLFENLAAGIYDILVTDDNNCITTLQATVTEPNTLGVSIANVNNVDCSGEATGDIAITVTGGTEPYSYSWSNSATSQNLTDVLAGSYTVTVTDDNGCSVSANATISEPASPLSLNISKVDANTAQGCTNGEATANVSGGTAPYTYLWSASANNQTAATATDLPVGSHSVTVTDANGCQLTQSIVIVCVNTCDAEITIETITNVLCVGDATGSGIVSANSNANPGATFTFTWSNGQVDTGVTSSTLSGVTAGVYDVSVTIDGTVCQPVEETISITEPINALNITATSTDELGPNTNDGTASATATGGVEPYTFLWSPNGETTQNISGLSAGTYMVTVTDANGCTDTATVTVNPGTCNNLSISGTSTPVICNGESNGSVTAVVSNGTGPFTYAWNTLSDTTPSVSNLPAGSYTVTVTDQTTLCTQSTTITVNEPNALSTGIAVTNILCRGDSTGSVDLTVNGGTSPYTYLWNTGDTTEDLIDVVAGTYSVTITDANGCTATNQSTVQEPAEVVAGSMIRIVNVECLGESTGSLTAEGSGGIPPYTYSIDNGATSQASGLFENLAAGNYTILITDANGCTFGVDGTIDTDDTESPEISVPSTITIEGCSVLDIITSNAVFAYSNTQSDDVKTVFDLNPDYNATDDFNIESITYVDVITSVNDCPITVSRTFTITDNCGNTATTIQTITVEDT
ncbi:Ig-like domain-containing protein, partial [Winogradskyella luteola]